MKPCVLLLTPLVVTGLKLLLYIFLFHCLKLFALKEASAENSDLTLLNEAIIPYTTLVGKKGRPSNKQDKNQQENNNQQQHNSQQQSYNKQQQLINQEDNNQQQHNNQQKLKNPNDTSTLANNRICYKWVSSKGSRVIFPLLLFELINYSVDVLRSSLCLPYPSQVPQSLSNISLSSSLSIVPVAYFSPFTNAFISPRFCLNLGVRF
ncbi:hypothetical protein FF38_05195 [Lucilia cuprina]|uniref:Uncharacterized protein n=1 Tax=Lucilia cuprina TaxID=7375 RepID=A0A0L0C7J6_LUCCU|nr:hypothetical protein FF38_05195 [Lucilia cuprina]